MKRLVLFVVMLAFSLSCTASNDAAANREEAEKELLQLERQLVVAVQHRDTEALNRIWADEYLGTAPDGSVVSKGDLLAAIKDGAITLESLDVDEQRVRLFGNVALITGHAVVKAHVGNADYSGAYRGTGIYLKRQGRWEVIGVHVGPAKRCPP